MFTLEMPEGVYFLGHVPIPCPAVLTTGSETKLLTHAELVK